MPPEPGRILPDACGWLECHESVALAAALINAYLMGFHHPNQILSAPGVPAAGLAVKVASAERLTAIGKWPLPSARPGS